MRYFARVTAGTEEIAWREIRQFAGIQHPETAHRRLDFDYPGPPSDLLTLGSVDDIYVYVGRLQPVDHTRAALPRIAQGIATLDFTPAADLCSAVRPVSRHPRYTVTASLLGGRNYTRYDVAECVRAGLSNYGWHYVENAPDHVPVDLDIRILVEQDWLLAGIRLGAYPLHRRPYKRSSLPGSLKPPVAFCLCLLAELQPGDIVLDPMCGAGTIAIEAVAFRPAVILAADLNPQAIQHTRRNAASAGIALHTPVAAARHLPLASHSVDRIVSNLPWGKQVPADLPQLYAGLVSELERVLRPGGRGVLLTDSGDLLLPAVATCRQLRLAATRPISLYGSHPTVYSIVRL